MNTEPTFLVLCTKDMMKITGKSESTVLRIRRMIKERSRKNKCSFITLEEFCDFTGLSEEKVLKMLR